MSYWMPEHTNCVYIYIYDYVYIYICICGYTHICIYIYIYIYITRADVEVLVFEGYVFFTLGLNKQQTCGPQGTVTII